MPSCVSWERAVSGVARVCKHPGSGRQATPEYNPLFVAVAVTGTMVTPVLGFLTDDVGDLSHFKLSRDEVDSVFVLTFSQLLDPELR